MDIKLESPNHSFFGQLLPFVLSFLDDILLFGLSRLGLHLRWLHWLSPIILAGTVIYFAVELFRHRHLARKVLEMWRQVRFLGMTADHTRDSKSVS